MYNIDFDLLHRDTFFVAMDWWSPLIWAKYWMPNLKLIGWNNFLTNLVDNSKEIGIGDNSNLTDEFKVMLYLNPKPGVAIIITTFEAHLVAF